MPTQTELDQIWNNINSGKYKDYPLEGRPEKLIDEEHKQIMSTPNAGSTARHVYERHPGKQWREVRFIGSDHPFS
jgi:hypothetical protein